MAGNGSKVCRRNFNIKAKKKREMKRKEYNNDVTVPAHALPIPHSQCAGWCQLPVSFLCLRALQISRHLRN